MGKKEHQVGQQNTAQVDDQNHEIEANGIKTVALTQAEEEKKQVQEDKVHKTEINDIKKVSQQKGNINFPKQASSDSYSYQRKENPKGTLIDMFKEKATQNIIIEIYEGANSDFELALQRCIEILGVVAEVGQKLSELPQEFADGNQIDSEEYEEE